MTSTLGASYIVLVSVLFISLLFGASPLSACTLRATLVTPPPYGHPRLRRARHCTPLSQHGLAFSQPSEGFVRYKQRGSLQGSSNKFVKKNPYIELTLISRATSALGLQQLLQTEHLVAVLGCLGKVELLGGLLHKLACTGNALLQLTTRHIFHDGVGGFSQLRIAS